MTEVKSCRARKGAHKWQPTLDKLQQQIQRSQNMLNNENFVTRAKSEVVERERKTLSDLQASMTQIVDRIAEQCQ